jgi:hypothetical protein
MNGFLSSLSEPTITANSEEEAEAQNKEGKRPAPSASTAVCGDD